MNIEQSKARADELCRTGYTISDVIRELISEADHSGFERGEDHIALYFSTSLLMVSLGGATIYHQA